MRLTLFATFLLVVGVIAFSFMQVNAAETKTDFVFGSGTPCLFNTFNSVADHYQDKPDVTNAETVSLIFKQLLHKFNLLL